MRRRASLLVVPGFIAATLLLTWPMARDGRHAVPTNVVLPDALFQAFLLDWDLRTLPTRPASLFDVPIFHPERNTLAYMDHLLGETAVAAPVAAAGGGLALAYDVVVWVSFVASALAMYRLVRLVGVSRGGAFACGVMFAFAPYRWSNMANLNLLQTQFLPLGLLFAVRWSHRGRARDLLAAGATLAAQSYFSWYHTFHLATALATVAVVHAVAARPDRPAGAARLPGIAAWTIASATTVVLMLPGLLPYLRQRQVMRGFERSLGAAAFWSADVLDYFRVNVESRLLGGSRWLAGDQAYAPGLVATLLAGVAVVAMLRGGRSAGVSPESGRRTASWTARLRSTVRAWGDAGTFAAVAAVGFVLSLGPVLRVAGHRLWVPLPYALLFYVVPGFASMRAAGRFAVLVLAGVVVLAGLGYEELRRRWAMTPVRRWTLFASTLALTVIFAWSVPWPMLHVPSAGEAPSVYRWLAARPGAEPVLVLPVPPTESQEDAQDVLRQFYAVYHRKPLVDGVSGFVSPAHRAFRTTLQSFPDSASLRAAAARGTRLVIVHYGDWPDSSRTRLRERAAREPTLRELATFGDDVAYALTREPGTATTSP